jgi:hypothetical protein
METAAIMQANVHHDEPSLNSPLPPVARLGLGIRSTRLFGETSGKTSLYSHPRRYRIHRTYQVRYALRRGHKVTTFNRGKTHPSELPSEVEQLIGDRNGKLDALKGRTWDVAIDNPTTLPVWVRDAAQILKGNVGHFVFVSTISVYADTSKGADETAPLAKYEGADPYKETLEAMKASGYKTHGPLKRCRKKKPRTRFRENMIIRLV